MENKNSGLGGPSLPVLTALRRILRPLVRFLLTQGVTYPYLSDFLKSVYVDVAINDFPLEAKRQTDSRISLLTGVHRKDVKRLTAEVSRGSLPPPSISLGAQLVGRWVSQKRFIDDKGHPSPLPRLSSVGGEKSFDALVASVSKDIRSRAVLDEWLRLGVARVDENDCVCLIVDAFVPERGFDEKAFYLGQNVGDHLTAAVVNVLADHSPFIERSVYYDELSAESIKELRDLSSELGMQALQKINKRAIELEAKDATGKRKPDQRMNFGIYFFSAKREGDTPPDQAK